MIFSLSRYVDVKRILQWDLPPYQADYVMHHALCHDGSDVYLVFKRGTSQLVSIVEKEFLNEVSKTV